MVTRLSGRPRRKIREEEKEKKELEGQQEEQQVKKVQPHFKLLVLIAIFALIAALGSTAGIIYFISSGGFGNIKTSNSDTGNYIGPSYDMGEFIVNLGSLEERRFLKVSITLSFTTKDKNFEKLEGEELAKSQKEFSNLIKPRLPIFKDTILSLLSSKSAEEINTPEGKENLKKELIVRLNDYTPQEHQVREVYFTDFIVQ